MADVIRKGRPLTAREASGYLDRILGADALELHILEGEEGPEILIPYMMNDAAEFYLRLSSCRLPEDLLRGEDLTGARAMITGGEGAAALVLYVPGGVVRSVFFRRAYMCGACYRYGNIGHDWRSEPGEEDIRRLVNLVCVLHDKMEYMGEGLLRGAEQSLALLAEFGPLRTFSPIDASILSWYPESRKGALAALNYAGRALDRELACAIEAYAEGLQGDRADPEAILSLSGMIADPAHARFLEVIDEALLKAGSFWPARDYGGKKNAEIAYRREQVLYRYRQMGYTGDYPLLTLSDGGGTPVRRVRFMEEHPFTVMEEEGVDFQIFSMARDLPGGTISLQRE